MRGCSGWRRCDNLVPRNSVNQPGTFYLRMQDDTAWNCWFHSHSELLTGAAAGILPLDLILCHARIDTALLTLYRPRTKTTNFRRLQVESVRRGHLGSLKRVCALEVSSLLQKLVLRNIGIASQELCFKLGEFSVPENKPEARRKCQDDCYDEHRQYDRERAAVRWTELVRNKEITTSQL